MTTLRLGCILLSAIGLLLAMSPWRCGWLALLSLAPWAMAVRHSENWRECGGHGWILGFCFYSLLLDWIRTAGAESDWNWTGPHFLAWVALSLTCSVSLGAHSLLLRWLFVRNCPAQLAVPIVFTLHEIIVDQVLRRHFGVNGALVQLALTQVHDSPILQMADLGGAFLVTWLVAVANGLVIDVLGFCIDARCLGTPRWRWSLLIGISQLVCAVVYGVWRTEFPERPGPPIGLVTTYAPVRGENPSDRPAPALWIYPEDANSTAGLDADTACVRFRLEAARRGCPILIGCRRFEELPTPRLRNSLLLVSAGTGLVASYDKQHLTPDTEIASPVRAWIGGREAPTEGWFAPGDSNAVCHLPGGQGTIGLGICHDVCFPEWSRSLLNEPVRPDILVVCGAEQFDATGRVQHLLRACAQLRAVESRRPLIRCVQHGLSGMVDGCGRIRSVRVLSPFELMIDSVPLDGRTSVYAQIGDSGFFGFLGLMMIVAAVFIRRRSKSGGR